MLLGEHAVLHGRRALVCAIDQRISVNVFQCLEKVLRIDSELGQYEAPLDNLVDHPDFRFVLDVVKQYPQEQGVELKIESDFSSDIGFGSSAAVTVATHAALLNCHKNPPRPSFHSGHPSVGGDVPNSPPAEGCPQGGVGSEYLMELFHRSLATIHRVQGRGSGADVAASVFGGVIAYRADPLEIQNVVQASRLPFHLTAVYSGSKMKTADVIRHLEEKRALNAAYFEKIFDRMDASVGEVIEDFPTLGKKLIENQFLMEEMGLCNAALAEIIQIFQTLETPAKISGSGLGDCAIGLTASTGLLASGGQDNPFGGYPVYALQVDPQGVIVGCG